MVRFVSKEDTAEKTHRGLEVIAAGLSRCATSSLQAALESTSIGYAPTMHMLYVLPYSERLQLVIDALREKDRERRQKILHKIFDGYGVTCDFPGMIFVDDLMDMYPNAKVVLNQRASGEDWVESIYQQLAGIPPQQNILCNLLPIQDRPSSLPSGSGHLPYYA